MPNAVQSSFVVAICASVGSNFPVSSLGQQGSLKSATLMNILRSSCNSKLDLTYHYCNLGTIKEDGLFGENNCMFDNAVEIDKECRFQTARITNNM